MVFEWVNLSRISWSFASCMGDLYGLMMNVANPMPPSHPIDVHDWVYPYDWDDVYHDPQLCLVNGMVYVEGGHRVDIIQLST